MKSYKSSFKNKATAMINAAPQSMKDFLEDNPQKSVSVGPAQTQNTAITKMHNQTKNKTDYVRFHVHIRQDLAEKVFTVVYERKKNKGRTKKEASQRAIIEEALDKYFK